MRKEEKKAEYRISVESNLSWGIAYYAEKREYFLWIWYWKKLSSCWLSDTYTVFRHKEQAERLIEEYKNGEIKVFEDNIVWYY